MPAATEPPFRDLRLRIARLRRRIDGRVRSVEHEARRLMSWRGLVERYPAYALLAAAAAGMSVSVGLRRGQWLRWLGARLLRQSADKVFEQLWQQAASWWAARGESPRDRSGHDGT